MRRKGNTNSKYEICMMKILLIAATHYEIESFINHEQIDVLICGVGSPFTIYHLTKKLLQSKRITNTTD